MINPYSNYQENSVMTASTQKLTLMLYEGAIKNCNVGLKALEDNDLKKAHENIVKAQNIVMELINTLDLKYPVSEQMQKMYTYIYELLVTANTSKKAEPLLEAVGYIREFKDTWKLIMQKK